MNLIEGMNVELNRNRDLLEAYKKVGSPGIFAVNILSKLIERGEAAMGSGDTVEMIAVYQELKESD